ncbi:gluconate operon transcriptional repressor GntR [Marinomonas sp. 15G1-11]|uniref:Gluconate operon transcriptional repressor GntR n=1 Tax=Marinomonas phaeophyticola TaxID=3004091 RepID=A0ABT4JSL7_9GAMM|nr:gluconate operon transcriptional repressor GntR [Marinomonas sp. 15G1-11]MCZ2721377.1 gluconate operon transcriptional repressor GntR [Marinomonas sp. 15G1-11]
MTTKKNKRPTLQHVADKVGVTKMTVSRYLRDPKQVSEQLRSVIESAVEELGYIPNRAPDILSNAKSHAIGVLVPSLTNQVFAEVIRGIETELEPSGYQTMLAHYGYSPLAEESRIATLLSYNVDGLILSESVHTERVRKMLSVAGVPVIEIMDSVLPPLEQAIGINNEAAARDMTELMISKGRKHIVYLAARMDERTQQKIRGYEAAMLRANLQPKSLQTVDASSFTMGAKLLLDAIRENPQTDGLFCTNDDLAIGALYECQRQGIAVPEQISIAGFHGHDITKAMIPRLATVVTPREEMGRQAAAQMMARLNGAPIEQKIIELPYYLEVGQSLGG